MKKLFFASLLTFSTLAFANNNVDKKNEVSSKATSFKLIKYTFVTTCGEQVSYNLDTYLSNQVLEILMNAINEDYCGETPDEITIDR